MEIFLVAAVSLIGLGSTAALTVLGRLGIRLAALHGRVDVVEGRLARLESPAVGGGVRTGLVRRVDSPRNGAPAGRTLIAVPNLSAVGASRGARSKASARAELRRRFAVICELADAGASAESIARATGQPIGRVELVLGLRRRAGAGPRRP
jgi:hypothetical protein